MVRHTLRHGAEHDRQQAAIRATTHLGGYPTSLADFELFDSVDRRKGTQAAKEGGASVVADLLAKLDGSPHRPTPRDEVYRLGTRFMERLATHHGLEGRDRPLIFPGASPLWSQILADDRGYEAWDRGYGAKLRNAVARAVPPAAPRSRAPSGRLSG